jgi:hypothetical protein
MKITAKAINEKNRDFWLKQKSDIHELLSTENKKYIIDFALRREARKTGFVKLATSNAERIERLRTQVSFECEVKDATEDLSLLPIILAQRDRAKKPRVKLTEEGRSIRDVIKDIALHSEHRDKYAKELWPHFFAKLEQLDLEPTERDSAETGSHKWAYSYNLNGKPRSITYSHFANIVSACRSQKKSD